MNWDRKRYDGESSMLSRPESFVRAERARLISKGLIRTLEQRMRDTPCLHLLPGEREKFEAHAIAASVAPRLFGSLVQDGRAS